MKLVGEEKINEKAERIWNEKHEEIKEIKADI